MHPCQMVGLDTGSVAKKIVLTFLLHVLKNIERNVGPKMKIL